MERAATAGCAGGEVGGAEWAGGSATGAAEVVEAAAVAAAAVPTGADGGLASRIPAAGVRGRRAGGG